ncbi:MAG: polysaccharide biosynthesis tyrosine autokinase [Kineosporiaceae bacterium]|nr:polysaccharide biosynthesis tyrosine autokinase [Kineosporiaceae bacterium]
MNLRQIVAAIVRWRLPLAAVLLASIAIAGAYAGLAQRTYTATSTLFFVPDRSATVNDLAQGNNYTQGILRSYGRLATLPVVLDPVINELKLGDTAEDLAERISVETPPNTVLMSISATDVSAERSAAIANAVAAQIPKALTTLAPPSAARAKDAVSLQVTTVATARTPAAPSDPNVPVVMAAGIAMGLILAGLIGSLLEFFVSPLLTSVAAGRKAPVLGVVPRTRGVWTLPLGTRPRSSFAEAVRTIRTNVQRTGVPDTLHTMVVTSALPREGRTTLAVNLALSLARTGRSAIVVDADLRRPGVARLLAIEDGVGLSDVLRGEVPLGAAVREWRSSAQDSPLVVLTSGRVDDDAAELIAREEMNDLIKRLASLYTYVVIDAPPLLEVTDASLIAARVDGTLLIARDRQVTEHQFEAAIDKLELAGGRLEGVVINGAHRVSANLLAGRQRETVG